jgi:hypothetical protein
MQAALSPMAGRDLRNARKAAVATRKATAPSVPRDIIEAVPRICEFYGIVIFMYYGDHPLPHFHASYGDDSAKVDLATGGDHRGLAARPGVEARARMAGAAS